MFSLGDKVRVKSLITLLNEGNLKLLKGTIDTYINIESTYIINKDSDLYDKEFTIIKIDENDSEIPYQLSNNKWVPTCFLIPTKQVNIFDKLVALDNTLACFSFTRFSHLKRIELEYIAKLLMNNGASFIDLADTNQKRLATYCSIEVRKL